jgi:hypothetical protein
MSAAAVLVDARARFAEAPRPTVGDRALALRERLACFPVRNDCKSFAGTPLYRLGMSFFPADLGLYDPHRERVSTVVLGSDWGNESSFFEYLARERHHTNATVYGAERMLQEAGFSLGDCFYTNAWPVMRAGASKEQNHHPMRDDIAFTNAYRWYLREVIQALDIRLVISLGNSSAWFVGPFFGPDWSLGRLRSPRHVRIRHLDIEPLRRRDGVVFVNATHPSHLEVNRRKRSLNGFGDETELLVCARRLAGIPDAPGWN